MMLPRSEQSPLPMSFNDFFEQTIWKTKQHRIKKAQHIPSSLAWKKVKIYLRDGTITSYVGIVNLHKRTNLPTKGTHWGAYINPNYFDSWDCSPHRKLSMFITKRNGHCI